MFTNKINIFSIKAKQDAIEHCRSCLPNEGCGIISKDKFIPFENRSEAPGQEFIIDDDRFNYLLATDMIDAIIHSHINYPHASEEDQQQQRALEIPFGIVNFQKGCATHLIFFGDTLETEPLIQRPFFFGVFDCLSLARDYWKQKFNIRISTPIRSLGYWKREQSLFEDHINSDDYPVDFINKNEAKPGDVLFYKMVGSKYINHVGSILDTGKVMHHFINKISCTLPPSYYQEMLYMGGRLNRDLGEV